MVTVFAQSMGTEPLPSQSRLRKCFEDFRLLGSVWLAYFIVWRAVRHERRAKDELKLLRED